ncbi:MAG: glycosyltransferase family 4 protein [Lachnospira sp.]|nr:glycosyltransferase family 4 protein [Lachnospira sp.]
MKEVHIYQMLPTVRTGDAVSNDAVALENTLRQLGYETMIYALNIGSGIPSSVARSVEQELPQFNPDDILLYHLSTGSILNFRYMEYNCRKVLVYHNITPPTFFARFDPAAAAFCQRGLKEAVYMGPYTELALADSQFNADELRSFGYTCPIDVLPILIPFEDYEKTPTRKILNQKGQKTTFLFTGRVAPNKKQEDLMLSFYYYKKYYNQNSRLVLAGSFDEAGLYGRELQAYRKSLGLSPEDVIFTGHIRFADILAWYRCADAFLCLSEHEGFCVPLVEAMYFHLPILAYDSTAVGETMGGGGLLLEDKDPLLVAGAMDRVIRDQKLRETLVDKGQERLKDFDRKKITEQFTGIIDGLTKGRASAKA